MVELPEGKMKSREELIVDADDLMEDASEAKEVRKNWAKTTLKRIKRGIMK